MCSSTHRQHHVFHYESCAHACSHELTRANKYVFFPVYGPIRMLYTYMNACMRVHVHVHTHNTHTHTHTHT